MIFELLVRNQRRDALRLRIRQRAQQEAIEQAGDCGVHADGQRESHHHRRCKSRTPVQLPQSKAKVFDHEDKLRQTRSGGSLLTLSAFSYSFLSACMGSTLAARRAGSRAAARDTTSTPAPAVTKLTGSWAGSL